jgi:tetratricopeptide (TPR) repeat protein
VQSISVTGTAGRPAATTAPAPPPVDAGLGSLRRAADAMTDPRQAVERYAQFIDRTKDPATVEQARADLKLWQDRLDKGLVKVGPEWVTPDQRDGLVAAANSLLEDARLMLLDGRAKPAGETIDQVLAVDPHNPAANYLKGVMQLADDQVTAARASFTAALAGHKADHAPTLNNLAVIAARTRQVPGAVALYDRAITAQPMVRPVLDNIAELLGTMPEEMRNTQPVKRLTEKFSQQDVALATELAKVGLYRWGGTWVNAGDIEKVKAAEQRVAAEVEGLQREFGQAQDRVRSIEDEIDATERAMRRLEASRYGRDAEGRSVTFALPRDYYRLARDREDLQAKRAEELRKIEQLRARAKQAQANAPAPRYTGTQRPIGVEGAPGLPPLPDQPAEARG